MTKYVLIGGYARKAPDGGKALCEEMVRGLTGPVKILDCMFARLQESWEKSFADDVTFFENNLLDRKIDLKLADYDTFIEQVKWADVVFLRGGSSEELVKALREKSEWKEHIDGKTVAGTSAGADALSKYYFGLDALEVREGINLVPVKVIPHFRSDYHGWEFDWDKAYAELKEYKENLPILALAEGQFEVK